MSIIAKCNGAEPLYDAKNIKIKIYMKYIEVSEKEIRAIKLGLFIIGIDSLPIQLCCQFFVLKWSPIKEKKQRWIKPHKELVLSV